MRKFALNGVLLLIASSQLVGFAQDATKSTATKAVEKKVEEKKPEAKKEDVKKDEDKKPTSHKPEEKKPTSEKAVDKKPDEKKTTNRLPSNYGKLGLADAQKTKVYAVQDKYEGEIDVLNEKLKSLKAKRDTEIEAVLTADQKKTLKELTASKEAKNDEKESKDKK